MIGSLILIISVIYSAILCQRNLSDQFRDAKISFVTSAGIWLASRVYSSTELPYNEIVGDISLMVTYSIILVALLMIIRKLKPTVFRYPYAAVFMPLIIPFSYYLIYQTSLMRETIIHSVSGMIILVVLFLSTGYKTEKITLISTVAGAVLLTSSIAALVFLDDDQYIHTFWYLITSTGVAVGAYGFVSTFNNKIIDI